jgi:hypothetical protein
MTKDARYIPLDAATDAISRGLADMVERKNGSETYVIAAFTLDTSGAVDFAALIAAARAEERERCARVAAHGCLVPPNGGSPEPWEADLCDEIARRIRARR